MAENEPMHAVSDDGDLFFAQNTAPIYKAARLVIDEIGEDAATYATTRADLLHREGDVLGAAVWRRVAPLVDELLRKQPRVKPMI